MHAPVRHFPTNPRHTSATSLDDRWMHGFLRFSHFFQLAHIITYDLSVISLQILDTLPATHQMMVGHMIS
jgi:hypothetical protein